MDVMKKFGVEFEIPKIKLRPLEISEQRLENIVKNFITNHADAIYIGYPFKKEAFPCCFITPETTWNVFESVVSGSKVCDTFATETQTWNEVQKEVVQNSRAKNINDSNLHVKEGDFKVIVGC